MQATLRLLQAAHMSSIQASLRPTSWCRQLARFDPSINTACPREYHAKQYLGNCGFRKVYASNETTRSTSLSRIRRLHRSGDLFVLSSISQEKTAAYATRTLDGKSNTQDNVRLEDIRTSVGDAFGARSKSASDAFCARLMATRACSMKFIITTLKLLSVDQLGPLALRELAARTATPFAFVQELQDLRLHGITSAHNTFSVTLRYFATQGDHAVWHYMIRSDRHPETYDDVPLQESMFESAVRRGQLSDAGHILNVLSTCSTDAHTDNWNRLLQDHCNMRSVARVKTIVDKMLLTHVQITDTSLTCIREHFLERRRVGRRPVDSTLSRHGADLRLVIDLQLDILRSGQYVQPRHWHELLIRLGMTGRLEAFETLALQLAQLCSTNKVIEDNSQHDSSHSRSHKQISSSAIDKMFKPAMQRAMVAWAQKSNLTLAQRIHESHSEESRTKDQQSKACGIPLLNYLARMHSLTVDWRGVKKELGKRKRPLMATNNRHKISPSASARVLRRAGSHVEGHCLAGSRPKNVYETAY